MTSEEFREALELAAAEVATWPEWKRNVVRDSMSPTVPTPRPYVDNSRPECEQEIAELKSKLLAMAERVAGQSEILSQRAGKSKATVEDASSLYLLEQTYGPPY